jgi:alpha-amylase/alpha-mannosidase (GH57 family)
MPPTHFMLLWHMHQPYYKDLAADFYTMPWVRLHALKDYYGMVAMLREFPSVHVTFNLVPSLIAQIRDYAADTAREEAYSVAFKPAERLTLEERQAVLHYGFQINHRLLNRYPRFRELYDKARPAELRTTMARYFTVQDILDLQVLSQVAWFDEIYLNQDPEISRLAQRGRGFTEEDKALLRAKELEILNRVLEEYRSAEARGQIEISTSPFYHPILPLLCDSQVAAESHPGMRLPGRIFRHPEDARDQLRAAVELHTRVFGRRPRGLWPSEGSLSEEVLRIAAEEGFEWTACDEGVLGRSLGVGFSRRGDGSVAGARELYRPYRFSAGDRAISIFFRDHEISDLIGFVYSRMRPEAAAVDLYTRLVAAGRSVGEHPAVVSVILDGENAWEFYPGNGREFLRNFYALLEDSSSLRAVTASEALRAVPAGVLTHLVPGSWINANFDVWIGHEEDHRAWELLTEAREFFGQRAGDPNLAPGDVEKARHELWVAEGSDWCWWYGPEHSTDNDERFDLLYRQHLSNIYHLLGASPPDILALPIKRPRFAARHVPPSAPLSPVIDGQVTTYFEWLGAGFYSPDHRSGTLHGAAPYIDTLYYGEADGVLYLRVDLGDHFLKLHPEFEVRFNLRCGERAVRLHAEVLREPSGTRLGSVRLWEGEEVRPVSSSLLRIAAGNVLELALSKVLLSTHARGSLTERTELQLSLWARELPVEIVPPEGWLTLLEPEVMY